MRSVIHGRHVIPTPIDATGHQLKQHEAAFVAVDDSGLNYFTKGYGGLAVRCRPISMVRPAASRQARQDQSTRRQNMNISPNIPS